MNLLTNLEIDEVSFVDAGANPEAHVTIFKRKEVPDMDEQKISETPQLDDVAKADGFDELTATLKSLTDKLNAHIEKAGTFEEVCKRGDGLKPDDIHAFAAEIQKSNLNLTKRQALDAAYLQHPELQRGSTNMFNGSIINQSG